jgi:2-polyprenyl-3-methyl-5-hydroxy-6-metoxy-1,4-benzoquinol methylase
LLHKELKDIFYGSSITVDVYGCLQASCRHLFVYPTPSAQQIALAYSHYPTHSTDTIARPLLSQTYSLVVDLFGMVDKLMGQKDELAFMGLRTETQGRLLDVGCGSGLFLQRMRNHGWHDCHGIDIDPKAIQAARQRGLSNVYCKSLDDLAGEDGKNFTVVTLNHVIEHFLLPEKELRSISRLLSPTGRVILRTPNGRSLFSRALGRYWRGLESPRHLNVFSIQSLATLAARCGFEVSSSKTSNAMLQGVFLESIDAAVHRWPRSVRRTVRVFARLFFPVLVFVVSLVHRMDPDSGEEIVMVLRPQP